MSDITSDPPLKQCKKCAKTYPATLEFFYKIKQNQDGLSGSCRECINARKRAWAQSDRGKEYYRRYYLDNHEKIWAQNKRWRSENAEHKREMDKRYREHNRERVLKNKRQWYNDNRDKIIQNVAQWRKLNPNKHRKNTRAYYQRHRKRIRQYHKEYRQQFPAKEKAKVQRRRAREQGAPGQHSAKDIHNIYSAQEGRCGYCGMPVGDRYHVDHMIPLIRGGTNAPENLCIACPSCNLEKGDKTPDEWAKIREW